MAGSEVHNFGAGHVTLGALGLYVVEHQLYTV